MGTENNGNLFTAMWNMTVNITDRKTSNLNVYIKILKYTAS